jgi:hypothetical protein
MHPILAEWRRLVAYVGAWAFLGVLLAPLLVLAAPFGWVEAAVFAMPLAVLLGLVSLGSYWVCLAAPLKGGLTRAFLTQLAAGLLSAWLWLGAGRAWAYTLESWVGFSGAVAHQGQAAAVILGLGLSLYLLAAALHYSMAAFESSREAERRALQFEIASREAELRALRAQLHPHFLSNSLNSINALIAARPEEARRLCVRLADFLRRSLALGSREAIPLSEELDLAEQLLAIEKTRFGERLCHEIAVEGAARACPVPPLLLQPLVENAVTHGIAQLIDGGTIRVGARRTADALLVWVENPRDPDSPGRAGAGIGLANVKRRLAALHGAAAEVRVSPAPESFRVDLRLPCPD